MQRGIFALNNCCGSGSVRAVANAPAHRSYGDNCTEGLLPLSIPSELISTRREVCQHRDSLRVASPHCDGPRQMSPTHLREGCSWLFVANLDGAFPFPNEFDSL